MTKKILVLPGDGIGPEIVAEAVKVLDMLTGGSELDVELDEGLVGGAAYDAVGDPLPEATLALARDADAVLLGAVGGPKWEPLDISMRPEKGLLGTAHGTRAVRQPAPGDPLSAAGRGLDPEAGGGRRTRHHDRARADRRHLFRPAARHPRPWRTASARASTPWSTANRRSSASCARPSRSP